MAILNATIGNSSGGSSYGGSASNLGYSFGGTYGTGATASALSHAMMQEANAFNAEQARLNREFQERMSNTAYQRAVKDLNKAGINPILAYTSGASTPTGSYASSAMGNAYTDTYNESHNSGESQNWGSSWEHSETTSDIANQISAISGLIADTVQDVIDNKEMIGSAAKGLAEGISNKVGETYNKIKSGANKAWNKVTGNSKSSSHGY